MKLDPKEDAPLAPLGSAGVMYFMQKYLAICILYTYLGHLITIFVLVVVMKNPLSFIRS